MDGRLGGDAASRSQTAGQLALLIIDEVDTSENRITRRQFLRAGILGGASLVVAACGAAASSSPPASTASTPATGPSTTPSPAGSLPTEAPPSVSPANPPRPPLAERIAGLLIVGFRGAKLDDAPWLFRALRDDGLGGVVLFDRDQQTGEDRNVRSPEQLTTLVGDLRAAAGERSVLVSVDQEGGVVTRLSPAHGFPAVASEATVGQGTAAEARVWARGLAATLAGVGVDLNLAPVVDLNVDPDSPAIGRLDRSFGKKADLVVEMATIELEAHRAAGVRTTLKHFPGIGSATTNTDFGVADVTDTWTPAELEPFRRLIAADLADLIMAGHVVNDQLDPDRPASLSAPTITGVLREALGWDGVVVTDDLQAAAVTAEFGQAEAILLALEAGNDLLLLANQQTYDDGIVGHVVETIAAAIGAGRLDEATIDAAWDRVQRLHATGGTATGEHLRAQIEAVGSPARGSAAAAS